MSNTPASPNQIDIIKQFIEDNNGIQRANRYTVELTWPQFATNVGANQGEYNSSEVNNVTLYPSAVSFGGRAINYVYDNLQGPNYGRAIPNSSKYVGGIILTFLVTGNLKILNTFTDWMDLIYQNQTNGTPSYVNGSVVGGWVSNYYGNNIAQNFKINFLNLNGQTTQTWYFEEVYPVECLPLELSAKADTPLLYQVVLNYRSFTRGPVVI